MTNYIYTCTEAQALASALSYAGLADAEYECLGNELRDGLFEILIRTPYQKYEFYVDAVSREVLGVNAEPSTDLERLYPSGKEEAEPFAAA